ncbi:hypothetical protein [Stenotrophomonas oahuensis]|uniref:Uncharacterized protein n=1 Tax=Stenotrophomonas oahuensis TaxID=3003271 RepID=A0ABY9YNX0_9GAMM|nr:hypothetical protein [Stenotrophomonas sp. A5586]WNH52413.1 hypothetical protein PDM29_19150 [Stenotrophomonas sp. A5586]
MRTTTLRSRISGDTFKAPASRTGDWYGSSNRASDGVCIFEAVPEYRDTNPKIDMYREGDGFTSPYLGSTNSFRTVRDALVYFETRPINGHKVAKALRSSRA